MALKLLGQINLRFLHRFHRFVTQTKVQRLIAIAYTKVSTCVTYRDLASTLSVVHLITKHIFFQRIPVSLVPPSLIAFSLLGNSEKTTVQLKMAEALQNADQLMDESRYQECLDLLLAQPVSTIR